VSVVPPPFSSTLSCAHHHSRDPLSTASKPVVWISQVVTQRLMKLQSKGNVTQLRAELLVKRRKRSTNAAESWEVVRARGHLDEVLSLLRGRGVMGGQGGGGIYEAISILRRQLFELPFLTAGGVFQIKLH